MPMSHPAPREPVTLPPIPPDDLPRSDAGTRWLPKYAQDADRPYEGDPWSRQDRESSLQYSRFKTYLALPPSERSIAEAHRRWCAEHPDKSCIVQAFQKASSVHRWIERASSWDSFEDAKMVAANRRQLIRSATKHAEQMADLAEVAMLPTNELRERLRDQGGQLAIIAELDDVSLLKLANAMGRDLPAYQAAERKALETTAGVVVTPKEIKQKGELVRAMLADKSVGLLMERLTFSSVETVDNDSLTPGDTAED